MNFDSIDSIGVYAATDTFAHLKTPRETVDYLDVCFIPGIAITNTRCTVNEQHDEYDTMGLHHLRLHDEMVWLRVKSPSFETKIGATALSGGSHCL